MNEIALAYSDLPIGTGIAYNSDFSAILTPLSATGAQTEFETLQNLPPARLTDSVSKNTLTGMRFKHIKHKWKDYNIVIDATELSDTNIVFLQNFWEANYKYLVLLGSNLPWPTALKGNETLNTYIEVVVDGDEFTVVYDENIMQLPEITFKLLAVRSY